MKNAVQPPPGRPSTAWRTRWLSACVVASLAANVATSAPPATRFAVLSDTHLYDARLGTSGSAFFNYQVQNPNLAALSEPILDATLQDIITRNVRFVIISGDMTKDGEIVDHVLMAQKLQRLEQAGIQVFVVPGNHDINNHDAASYSGDTATPIPTASPQVFRALYQRFGYGQAIDHAPDSLSYVAEPVPGLWLLALDSAKWAESAQEPHPLVSGRLTPQTLAWALQKLQLAHELGKEVIAFMHHGVNMHFLAQPQVFGDYLVDDWPTVGATLAGAGLKAIFTGHYHALDAAWPVDASGNPLPGTLCDIQSSSLVEYPCAYRIAELDTDRQLHVESRFVKDFLTEIDGVPFQTYAEEFLREILPYPVKFQLMTMFPLLSDDELDAVVPLVVDGLVANYAGDESPSQQNWADLLWLLTYNDPAAPYRQFAYRTIGQLLYTFWIDLPPTDHQLVVPVGS